MRVQVFFTPNFDDSLSGYAAVVIDALRMTSVAAAAIANGCAGLLPVEQIPDAVRIARDSRALLGGECSALWIEGFDFSNSPGEYTRDKIAGKRLVITTTNGTRAVGKALAAKRVLLGAFINATAVAGTLREEEKVALICAGTEGRFTLEDALAAGCILRRILNNRLHAKPAIQGEDERNGEEGTLLSFQGLKPSAASGGRSGAEIHFGTERWARMCTARQCRNAKRKQQRKASWGERDMTNFGGLDRPCKKSNRIHASLDDSAPDATLDDAARASLMLYDAIDLGRAGPDRVARLHRILRETTHYNRLLGLGLAGDLSYCLSVDTVTAVPERRQDGWFA